MAKIRRDGDLEIASDLALQETTWTLQRAAWGIMAAILLMAPLGLFGGGFFGGATVGSAGGFHVDYPRFCRLRSPTFIDVFTPAGTGGEVRVWIALAYADRAEIGRVDPTPIRVESDPGGLTYVTKAATPGEMARVRFSLLPNRPGPLPGRIRVDDGLSLDFTQFVHP